MTPSLTRLLWKDARLLRDMFVAILSGALLMLLISWSFQSIANSADPSLAYVLIGLVGSGAFGIAAAAQLFAGEAEERTDEIWQTWPASPKEVALSKIVVLLGAAIVFAGCVAAPAGLLSLSLPASHRGMSYDSAIFVDSAIGFAIQAVPLAVLTSLCCRRMLPALVAGAIIQFALGVCLAPFNVSTQQWIARGVVIVLVAAVDVWLIGRWARGWRFDARGLFVARRGGSPALRAPRVAAMARWSARPSWRVAGSIAWKEWLSMRWLLLGAFVAIAAPLLSFHLEWASGLQLLSIPLLPLVFGVAMWRDDYADQRMMFCVHRGVSPRLFWGMKHLLWGGTAIGVALLAWQLIVFELAVQRTYYGGHSPIQEVLRLVDNTAPWSQVVLPTHWTSTALSVSGYWLLLYAGASLASAWLRRTALAVFGGILVAISMFMLIAFAKAFDSPIPIRVIAWPGALAMLAATYYLLYEGASSDRRWTVPARRAAVACGIVLLMATSAVYYRVTEIPTVDPGMLERERSRLIIGATAHQALVSERSQDAVPTDLEPLHNRLPTLRRPLLSQNVEYFNPVGAARTTRNQEAALWAKRVDEWVVVGGQIDVASPSLLPASRMVLAPLAADGYVLNELAGAMLRRADQQLNDRADDEAYRTIQALLAISQAMALSACDLATWMSAIDARTATFDWAARCVSAHPFDDERFQRFSRFMKDVAQAPTVGTAELTVRRHEAVRQLLSRSGLVYEAAQREAALKEPLAVIDSMPAWFPRPNWETCRSLRLNDALFQMAVAESFALPGHAPRVVSFDDHARSNIPLEQFHDWLMGRIPQPWMELYSAEVQLPWWYSRAMNRIFCTQFAAKRTALVAYELARHRRLHGQWPAALENLTPDATSLSTLLTPLPSGTMRYAPAGLSRPVLWNDRLDEAFLTDENTPAFWIESAEGKLTEHVRQLPDGSRKTYFVGEVMRANVYANNTEPPRWESLLFGPKRTFPNGVAPFIAYTFGVPAYVDAAQVVAPPRDDAAAPPPATLESKDALGPPGAAPSGANLSSSDPTAAESSPAESSASPKSVDPPQ